MKKTAGITLCLILALLASLSLAACQAADPWDSAVYLEDTALGEGESTVTVEVTADERSVTFTVSTDEATLGDALLALDLIAGEESQFGIYVKVVNGIVADYDIDQTYWQVWVNGEAAMTGVDGVAIENGAAYRLVRTK